MLELAERDVDPSKRPARREVLRTALGTFTSAAVASIAWGCHDSDRRRAQTQSDEPREREPDGLLPNEDRTVRGDAGRMRDGGPDTSRASDARSAEVVTASTPGTGAHTAERDDLTLAEPVPTAFATIVDQGPRASFRQTASSTTLDWLTIGVSMSLHLKSLPDRVLALLQALGKLRLGYPTDLLAHSLQTATRARRAGAPDDLVLAALCHRLGMAFTMSFSSSTTATRS